jgi:hypothetical protein
MREEVLNRVQDFVRETKAGDILCFLPGQVEVRTREEGEGGGRERKEMKEEVLDRVKYLGRPRPEILREEEGGGRRQEMRGGIVQSHVPREGDQGRRNSLFSGQDEVGVRRRIEGGGRGISRSSRWTRPRKPSKFGYPWRD